MKSCWNSTWNMEGKWVFKEAYSKGWDERRTRKLMGCFLTNRKITEGFLHWEVLKRLLSWSFPGHLSMLVRLWFLLGISHPSLPHEFLLVFEAPLRHDFSINLSRFSWLGYDTSLLWILALFSIYLSQGISQALSWALQIQRIRHVPCPQDVHNQASDRRQGQCKVWKPRSGNIISI